MPIKISEMLKIPTPRQILETGTYKAVIAGLVYPNNTYGHNGYKMQFLLQVNGPKGICYTHSIPFYLSLVEDAEFFKLMKNVAGVNNSHEMIEWLDEGGFINENDELDETSFIGLSVLAKVNAITKKNSNDVINTINEFTFCPDSEAIHIDETKLIPKMYESHSTKLIAAEGLEVVK